MNNAVSDEESIKELDDKRLSSPRRTRVIYGVNESLEYALAFISKVDQLLVYDRVDIRQILRFSRFHIPTIVLMPKFEVRLD